MDDDISEFENDYKSYWEFPDNYALVKSDNFPIDVYSIFTLDPRLMFTIMEDIEEARKLMAKMIEHGVKVFDNWKDFSEWYANRNK